VSGPLTGIVLAGGASRRLGQDKPLLRFGDRTLLEIVVDRVGAVCEEVIVAAGSRGGGQWPGLSARFVPDGSPGRGPLAGIQAGLRAASFDFALVVAADMPFLNPQLLAFIKDYPRTYEALVLRVRGRLQPLHAAYARGCLGQVDSLLAEGRGSMKELLSRLTVEVLPEEALRRYDPQKLSCFNINRPEDLERAQELMRRAADRPGKDS
jgi:molybdopterin-guanine dinucleotide biosynthesis protein A